MPQAGDRLASPLASSVHLSRDPRPGRPDGRRRGCRPFTTADNSACGGNRAANDACNDGDASSDDAANGGGDSRRAGDDGADSICGGAGLPRPSVPAPGLLRPCWQRSCCRRTMARLGQVAQPRRRREETLLKPTFSTGTSCNLARGPHHQRNDRAWVKVAENRYPSLPGAAFPSWSVIEVAKAFVVADSNGTQLCFMYFDAIDRGANSDRWPKAGAEDRERRRHVAEAGGRAGAFRRNA